MDRNDLKQLADKEAGMRGNRKCCALLYSASALPLPPADANVKKSAGEDGFRRAANWASEWRWSASVVWDLCGRGPVRGPGRPRRRTCLNWLARRTAPSILNTLIDGLAARPAGNCLAMPPHPFFTSAQMKIGICGLELGRSTFRENVEEYAATMRLPGLRWRRQLTDMSRGRRGAG